MTYKTVYLGLDISKHTIDCQFIIDNKPAQYLKIDNNPTGYQILQQHINPIIENQQSTIHACCESTGIYYLGIAQYLYQQQIPISVVNPSVIKSYAKMHLQRIKTDKQDAKTIAQYCQSQQPALWQPPSLQKTQLTALNRRIDQLNQLLTMEKNRIYVSDEITQASIQTVIDCIDQQINQCQQKIQQLIEQSDTLKHQQKLLQTIPGIGTTTANWLLSVLIDIDKFPTSKQLVSYLGLSPIVRQSGKAKSWQRISKMGDKSIRKALYMPARAACTRSKLWRPWFDAKIKAGKHPKQVYVLMMRKLVVYAYACLKTNQPFNPDLHKRDLSD